MDNGGIIMNSMSLEEIRKKGYQALENALGIIGMIRFLQQFETGSGNYTKERKKWIQKMSIDEISKQIDKKD